LRLCEVLKNHRFPWAVGLLSGINTYLLFLSGPLSMLLVSGALARPDRRFVAAFANALGTTFGIASLIIIGRNSDVFPKFEGESWKNTRDLVESYMHIGVILVASMPILLHPMVFFAIPLMDPIALLGCVLLGRFLKYCVMVQLACSGSGYIKLFGSSAEKAAQEKQIHKD